MVRAVEAPCLWAISCRSPSSPPWSAGFPKLWQPCPNYLCAGAVPRICGALNAWPCNGIPQIPATLECCKAVLRREPVTSSFPVLRESSLTWIHNMFTLLQSFQKQVEARPGSLSPTRPFNERGPQTFLQISLQAANSVLNKANSSYSSSNPSEVLWRRRIENLGKLHILASSLSTYHCQTLSVFLFLKTTWANNLSHPSVKQLYISSQNLTY